MRWPCWGAARPKPYRAEDFLRREPFRCDYRRIARFLLQRLDFESAYDVGCANGFLLSELQAHGKRVAGIELSPAVLSVLPGTLRGLVQVGDFATARGGWDLVCCIEVAEHIKPRRSRELVSTLTRLARQWIYFTAAPPGQVGRGHINCRPHAEWLSWFARDGWLPAEQLTLDLREHLSTLERAHWLRDNSLLLLPA